MANYRPIAYVREFVLLTVLLVLLLYDDMDSPYEIFRSGRTAAIESVVTGLGL